LRWKLIPCVGLFTFVLIAAGLTIGGLWLYFLIRPFLTRSSEVRPTLHRTSHYEGANAQIIEDVVAQPLETQRTGMEGVESIESMCADGRLDLTFYLRPGSDLRMAKVLGQSCVALAEPAWSLSTESTASAVCSSLPNRSRASAPRKLAVAAERSPSKSSASANSPMDTRSNVPAPIPSSGNEQRGRALLFVKNFVI